MAQIARMPPAGPLLKLTEVSRRYDSPDGVGSITVLDRISLEAQRGESLAIVGPSGSGKSTLLHIIGTLDRPTSGHVLLDGRDLNLLDEWELASVRNLQIGFVFQAHYLLPQCTVLENVLVPTLAPRIKTSEHRQRGALERESVKASSMLNAPDARRSADRATRLLARVGLADRLAHRPGQLSGGEQQRVAVVRALINQPQLLLADEPTGSLDPASAEQLAQLLGELNREEQVTLILVTHSTDLAKRMQRVFTLKNGALAANRDGG
jgi:lipoprotein-releasing system ATP-binding protein